MRMEHKSPIPDIEFNPSPRPFESRERFDIQIKPSTESVSEQPLQYQQAHTEHDQSLGHKTFENIRYTTFDAATPKEPQVFIQEKPFAESSITSIPKTKYSSVSQRVKTLEQCEQDPTRHFFKSSPVWNSSNESPSAQFILEKAIPTQIPSSTYQVNGMTTPNPVNETLEQISNKMQQYEQSHWSGIYDLKAPALVKHVTPNVKIHNGYESKDETIAPPLNQCHLEPGEMPEFCFAPRFTSDRKPSLVERIEKSLERELEKGPSRVLPHSVRTMPPSPQTISTEVFESTKRTIQKQTKQPEINEHHTDFNHIKNTFYEHNKPLQRNNTIDHIPTPIQAPEKVRIVCFLCANFKCAESLLN